MLANVAVYKERSSKSNKGDSFELIFKMCGDCAVRCQGALEGA